MNRYIYLKKKKTHKVAVQFVLLVLSMVFIASCSVITGDKRNDQITNSDSYGEVVDSADEKSNGAANEESDKPDVDFRANDYGVDSTFGINGGATGEETDRIVTDFGSHNYWVDFLQRESDSIDFLVQWAIKNDYCTSIYADGDEIYIEPRGKKTRKKIESSMDFDKVKEFLHENKLRLHNHWYENRKIVFLHEFREKDVMGNYCLTYIADQSNVTKSSYKKITEKLYTDVIFYE